MTTAALGYGDAVFKWQFLAESAEPIALHCEHADPRTRISPVLVNMWHHFSERGDWLSEIVRVACAPTCPVGDVITINCVNQRLIYRITGTEPGWLEGDDPFAYLAEWPD